MNRIKMIVVAACLCLVAGCEQGVDYTTTCDMKKVDGKVISVTVTLPHQKQHQPIELVFTDREQVQQLIDSLESLKIDLEMARDQMPVQEPPTPTN